MSETAVFVVCEMKSALNPDRPLIHSHSAHRVVRGSPQSTFDAAKAVADVMHVELKWVATITGNKNLWDWAEQAGASVLMDAIWSAEA